MIEIKHLSKTFQMKDGAVNALKNIDLTIPDGSIYGIIGMSGAGKSTLVRCINLLERPTEGSVVIDGTAMETLSPAALRERRRDITMIFQQFNLLMQRSCLKNICFPMELAGVKKADAEKRARELLEMVGLPDKANAYPAQLSGGQKQRIAIARALATNPKSCSAMRHQCAGPQHDPRHPDPHQGHQQEAGHHRGGHHPPDECCGRDLRLRRHSGRRRGRGAG